MKIASCVLMTLVFCGVNSVARSADEPSVNRSSLLSSSCLKRCCKQAFCCFKKRPGISAYKTTVATNIFGHCIEQYNSKIAQERLHGGSEQLNSMAGYAFTSFLLSSLWWHFEDNRKEILPESVSAAFDQYKNIFAESLRRFAPRKGETTSIFDAIIRAHVRGICAFADYFFVGVDILRYDNKDLFIQDSAMQKAYDAMLAEESLMISVRI